jgi:hypothetical protein
MAVDDAQMRITHVIRAEEHLTNTLRQCLIYEALDYPYPQYAHCSLILGEDRSKLSKRHGATSVDQFKQQVRACLAVGIGIVLGGGFSGVSCRGRGSCPRPCSTTWLCWAGMTPRSRRSSRWVDWALRWEVKCLVVGRGVCGTAGGADRAVLAGARGQVAVRIRHG